MPSHILDGLSLVDSTGRLILVVIATCLLASVLITLRVRARYADLEGDLRENGAPGRRFSNDVLNDIARTAQDAARTSGEPNTQVIIENHFETQLRGLLLGERFVRAATGLVIILGLMGTFYGLTLSIGKLVELVAGDPSHVGDVTQAVTGGLTQALSGMTVAFSNSLLGIASAVVLTVFGIFFNLTDRRVGLMVQIEMYLDAMLASAGTEDRRTARGMVGGVARGTVATFSESVERLDAIVGRFESALSAFSTSTRDFSEFNAHLKDNVQRMSLTFGDLNDALKSHVVALKRGNGQ